MRKSLIVIIVAIAAFATAAPASASYRHKHGYYHGYHGGYRIGYYGHRHYRGRHRYGYRHRYRSSGRALAAGLLLGGLFHYATSQPRVVERQVIYREPANRSSNRRATRGEPVPEQRHDIYYRKDKNGDCWLVETQEDGEQIITPQDAEICAF